MSMLQVYTYSYGKSKFHLDWSSFSLKLYSRQISFLLAQIVVNQNYTFTLIDIEENQKCF